tara:strand:+ start:183 stop:551 length:369 start_codon:yes stop_codon:yes gene_type:complete
MARLSLKYERLVKPSKVLPPDLIRGYYEQDAKSLKEIEVWLSKNGLTILFTLGEAYGNESVYLGKDNRVYIGTDKIPRIDWLKKQLLRVSTELLQQAIKEGWTRKKIFEELKKISEEDNPTV